MGQWGCVGSMYTWNYTHGVLEAETNYLDNLVGIISRSEALHSGMFWIESLHHIDTQDEHWISTC
jgi:hypothetical protein